MIDLGVLENGMLFREVELFNFLEKFKDLKKK